MADLAFSGQRRGAAAAALREWRAAAIESSANRWRETRLKRRVVKEWSDLAAAQRHDGYRAVKTAMLGWRVAIRSRERLEELVRSRKAERADDVACRILNCWASLTRRREFSETVLAAMTRLVKRDAWIRRIADDQRRKRLIERWYRRQGRNLRAGHWARRPRRGCWGVAAPRWRVGVTGSAHPPRGRFEGLCAPARPGRREGERPRRGTTHPESPGSSATEETPERRRRERRDET